MIQCVVEFTCSDTYVHLSKNVKKTPIEDTFELFLKGLRGSYFMCVRICVRVRVREWACKCVMCFVGAQGRLTFTGVCVLRKIDPLHWCPCICTYSEKLGAKEKKSWRRKKHLNKQIRNKYSQYKYIISIEYIETASVLKCISKGMTLNAFIKTPCLTCMGSFSNGG